MELHVFLPGLFKFSGPLCYYILFLKSKQTADYNLFTFSRLNASKNAWKKKKEFLQVNNDSFSVVSNFFIQFLIFFPWKCDDFTKFYLDFFQVNKWMTKRPQPITKFRVDQFFIWFWPYVEEFRLLKFPNFPVRVRFV